MAQIKKKLKFSAEILKNKVIYDLLVGIRADLADIKAKFDAHKHSFDGSQTTSAITGLPVTGTTSGTAAGGTTSPIGTLSTTGEE